MFKFSSVLMLILLFPIAAFCESSAIAISSGNVTLNGKAILRSAAVFPGDLLETDGNSAIVLQAKGAMFQVGPTAQCHLSRSGLVLDHGTARVSGSGRVQAGKLDMTPAGKETKYTVRHADGEVTVIAVQGSLVVQRGKDVLKLAAGETRSFADSGESFPGARSGRRTKLSAAVGAAAGASVGAVLGSHVKDPGPRGVSN